MEQMTIMSKDRILWELIAKEGEFIHFWLDIYTGDILGLVFKVADKKFVVRPQDKMRLTVEEYG